jgi:hypothetical protein
MEPAMVVAFKPRLVKIGWANMPFILLDIAVFALLVWNRHRPACEFGTRRELYPVMWLALATMHLCYVCVGCIVRLKSTT